LQAVTDHVIKLEVMKAVKIITNAYTLIVSFLVIMISGQHVGGFYVIYLLLALPHFAMHSILAITGIVLLLLIYHNKKNNASIKKSLLNIIAVLLLLCSIFFFFDNDDEHYNYGTFYQLIPQLTLILFGSISLVFILKNIFDIYKISRKNL